MRLIIAIILGLSFGFAQQAYTISVVPQFPRPVLFENWQPYLDYLSEQTGENFELVVHDTIPLFEVDFLEGNPDFAFMNPYHAVMAFNAQAYQPFISDASRQLKGILVVRADSPYQAVEDLDGASLAFPAPNAFGASLYMRALLAEQFGIDIDANYVETHANTYRTVLLGRAAAGGGVRNTLNSEPDELKSQLRVLYETPGVTPHPLAAHPRVPEALQQAVLEATLALMQDEAGLAILQKVQLREPFAVTYSEHYAQLDQLNLENYLVLDE